MKPDNTSLDIAVEIADSDAERQKGLMERASLEGGMLFVFPQEQELAFWMKDTLIPLDILYFDSRGQFVSVTTMQPCKADPCTTYPSAGPARFALEVNAGEAAAWGVGEGWILKPPARPSPAPR